MTIRVPRRQFEFDADGNIVEPFRPRKTIEEQRDDLLSAIRMHERFLSQKFITEEARASSAKRLFELREQLAELKSQTTHQHNP